MFESLRNLVNQGLPSRLTIIQSLTGLLAPPVCALCGAGGQMGEEPWGLDLCPHCEAACSPVDGLCRRCAEPLKQDSCECARCRLRPPAWDSVHCLFIYQPPVDDMITSLKFGHELVFARALGTLMAGSLKQSGWALPDCIVPIPLHRQRHLARGFNQSREIARHVAPRLGLRVESRLLRRDRATAEQSGLDAADRARNLAQAFSVDRRRAMPARIALLDDVLTTGSTADAAARALKAAGCRHVQLWVCARALRHGPAGHGG
jgi:ComF family protein